MFKSLIATLLLSASLASGTQVLAQAPAATTADAAATPSPGYLLVLGRSFDRNKIIAYSSQLPPIYAAAGGRYIGIGRPGGGVACIYGLCEGRSAVIAHWPNFKSVNEFWWGAAYRKAAQQRDGAGAFTVVSIKGAADVAPVSGSSAILVALLNIAATTTDLGAAQAWADLATSLKDPKYGAARLLAPITNAAVTSLEGDALYNRVVLLQFDSKEKRDTFAASGATQTFIKNASPLSLIAIISVDAPAAVVPAATAAAATAATAPTAK